MGIRPIELEFSLRTFKEVQKITFPESGMVMITGQASGASTTSGVGKSSILIAMAAALGVSDTPMSALSNWDTKAKPYIRFRFAKGDDIYDVIRDPKLSLVVNGVPIQGTATASEEELRKVVGDSDILRSLTYIAQRDSNRFLTFSDSKQKEYLTKVLDLGRFEVAEEELGSRLKAAQLKLSNVASSLAQVRAILETTVPPEDFVVEAAIKEKQRIESEIALAKKGDNSKECSAKIQLIDAELHKINNIVRESERASHRVEQLKAQASHIKNLESSIKNNKCPTCEQEWLTGESRLADLEEQKKKISSAYKEAMAIIKAAEPYVLDKTAVNSLLEKKNELMAELASKQQPIKSLESSLAMATNNLSLIESKRNQYLSIKERETRLLADEVEATVSEHLLSHAVNIVGRQGYLGLVFQGVLQEIETRANKFIGQIDNVSDFSISADSLTVTQSGKVNRKISFKIIKNGQEVPLKSLSGGQQVSIEFAVELAVIKVVQSRSGNPFMWLCLDESMDGLDYPLKAQWIDLIRAEVSGLLIVIDHASEIKELFDEVIEVCYDGKSSKLAKG